MKKEHEQVSVWTQGHSLLVSMGIYYPLYTTEIPIWILWCNATLCLTIGYKLTNSCSANT